MLCLIFPSFQLFLSTLSLRRATGRHITKTRAENFYPRSPCGERHLPASFHPMSLDFYPRSPCGERLFHRYCYAASTRFLSTLSLRRATTARTQKAPSRGISIHALLAESDRYLINTYHRIFGISIHALLAESDYDTYAKVLRVNISIHALLAESDAALALLGHHVDISIHALLAESDMFPLTW